MISIFPSERMVPAQGPSAAGPKPAPEQADTAKPSAFASMMSKDEQAAPDSPESVAPPTEAPAESKTSAELTLLDAETSNARAAEIDGDPDAIDLLAEGKQAEAPPVADTEIKLAEVDTPTDQNARRPSADGAVLESDTSPARQTLQGPDAESDLKPAAPETNRTGRVETPPAEVEPDLAAKTKPDSAVTPESQKDLMVGKSGTALSDVPANRSVSDEVQLRRQARGDDPQLAGEDGLRIQRGRSDADAVPPELKDMTTRSVSDSSAGVEKSLLAGQKVTPVSVTRDAPISFSDTLLAVGQSPSVPSQVAPGGLVPTQPAVLIAAPNDITSIIVNNLKNIADPQDQVIVQLDPPELGRVSIDFKFDAQGVQQITVTTENPEALKRLRELHFELTSALREHGLSEKNMSFRQHSDGQSQSGWQSQNQYTERAASAPLADLIGPAPIAQARAAIASNSRLDLTL